jgi:hypothetical protein
MPTNLSSLPCGVGRVSLRPCGSFPDVGQMQNFAGSMNWKQLSEESLVGEIFNSFR